MKIDPVLLELIVCPDCKGALEVHEAEEELRCVACGLIYPMSDGFPALLVDEARRGE